MRRLRMPGRARSFIAAAAIWCAALAPPPPGLAATRRIAWADTAPLHPLLEATGLSSASFAAYVDAVSEANGRRLREGDLDALVFYLLQSTRFTRLPPIEPALSAKSLIEGLGHAEREEFLRGSRAAPTPIAPAVRARATALIRALDSADADPRLAYFRELAAAALPAGGGREAALQREYLRVMRFLYEKEFVAQRAADAPEAVARLYRSRGLSTDTVVEAGYLVYLGLGVARSFEPARRVRRVLIAGPGLDLAPRTGLPSTW